MPQMPVPPYHTDDERVSAQERAVYHIYSDCPIGRKLIEHSFQKPDPEGKTLCDLCR